jgi:hypothetical protein
MERLMSRQAAGFHRLIVYATIHRLDSTDSR